MITRLLVVLALVGLISGCKLALLVTAAGDVTTPLGTHDCLGPNTCEIEISDATFTQSFTAEPREGYEFKEWSSGPGFLCAGSTDSTCVVSNEMFLGNTTAENFIARNDYYYLMPLFDNVGIFADIVNHLAVPPIYENALELPQAHGQTFLSDGKDIVGVDVYIGDPTRLNDPCCDTIPGFAELRLYDAADLNNYILLGVKEFDGSTLPVGTPASIDFDEPIPTVDGQRYAFFIFADDYFGLGLRSQTESTYSGGNEVVYPFDGNPDAPLGDEGRDLSFTVRGVTY